jgi:DHA2 family multidrug resistance protein
MLALCAIWMFFIHSMAVKQPLFDRRLMHNRNFIIAMGFMLALGVANVALASVLPTMFQTIFGYSVMDTGLLMAPRGCGVLVTMMVANRLVGRIDSRWMISSGYLIAAIALWMMTKWSLDMGMREIVMASFVQGLGLGLVFVPMNLVAFATLEAEYRTDGATLMALFRNLGSSLGISVIVTMLARNIQVSHADISAHVIQSNSPMPDLGGLAARYGQQGGALLEMLDMQINRQAVMIAYLDNFYMLFWVILAFVPFTWLLRKTNETAPDSTVHME